MTSSTNTKKCGVCSVNIADAVGEGRERIFTAFCSHAFHLTCISTNIVNNGNRSCPVCSASWNYPFLLNPNPNPNPNSNAIRLSLLSRLRYHPYINSQRRSRSTPLDPPCFNDDEPLPNANSKSNSDAHAHDHDHMLLDSLAAGELQKVKVNTIPECRAVPASLSLPQFAVLVELKAPSLSPSQRAPVDIVAVLDVSGSMSGKKLDLLKRAMHFVIDNLGDSDRLSVVSFSDYAQRVLPLRRMTAAGRDDAKRAVDSLKVIGYTRIVDGLTKGARVLDERRHKNPVSSIIFLSDGKEPVHHNVDFMHMLPASINEARRQGPIYPVHSFGFGSDHDPITMHAISDASRGTFSFIESIDMIQDAFAGCIGGLLSVVAQELTLKLRSASPGVEIKSIPSGRCSSEVSSEGAEGLINVGELYADEKKAFLINVSLTVSSNNERNTSVLDIRCSYREAISRKNVVIEGETVEVGRAEFPTREEMAVNLEVDRERNRVGAVESIEKAQQLAEVGNHEAAMRLLEEKISGLMVSGSSKAGDSSSKWLEEEMKEIGIRMGNASIYEQSGRAYALAGMSSHANQRATSRGGVVAGDGLGVGGYATSQMADMVNKSRQQQQQSMSMSMSKTEEVNSYK